MTPRWHCLQTTPQAEDRTLKWLKRHMGVYGFFPCTKRTKTDRGKSRVIVSRYIPGYVFAQFHESPVWHEFFGSCPFVYDTIRLSSGEPAILDPRDLEGLHAMRARDEEMAQQRRRANMLRKGDRVRLIGLLPSNDEAVEILDMDTKGARIKLTMFGSEREIIVSPSNVVKVA